jgi:hypothetical protein
LHVSLSILSSPSSSSFWFLLRKSLFSEIIDGLGLGNMVIKWTNLIERGNHAYFIRFFLKGRKQFYWKVNIKASQWRSGEAGPGNRYSLIRF